MIVSGSELRMSTRKLSVGRSGTTMPVTTTREPMKAPIKKVTVTSTTKDSERVLCAVMSTYVPGAISIYVDHGRDIAISKVDALEFAEALQEFAKQRAT